MKENSNILNWIKSITINLVIMIVIMLITHMAYETNDDYTIAARISGGYPYVGFVNYYLCKVLIAVQKLIPNYNVYVIFQIAVSFISFVYITKIILDKCSKWSALFVLTAILIIFSFDHYCAIQFTKTSALVLTTGYIALLDAAIEKKAALSYLASCLLIFIGVAIRYETMMLVSGISGVAVFAWFIVEFGQIKEMGLLNKRNAVTAIVLILVICGLNVMTNLSKEKNSSTEELKRANEYGVERIQVVDYPTYDYYDQNADKYEAIGISKNDLLLMDKWVFDYDGAASIENLKKINSVEKPKSAMPDRVKRSIKKSLKYVYQGMKNRSSNGIHIVLLILISITTIIALRPRQWLFVLALGGVSFALYVAVHFIQRVNYRGLYIADIGAALWLIYYYAHYAEKAENEIRNRIACVLGVIILAASVFSCTYLMQNCQNKYNRAAGVAMTEKQEAYFKEHDDKAFVWATGEKKMARRYATPLMAPDGSDDNVFNTGSWTVLTPFVMDKLSRYDLENPIKDLIDNDSAYFISNKLKDNMEEYLTKWYAGDGEKIQLIRYDEIAGQTVWKVMRTKE